MNVRFLLDMGERAVRSFIQGFFALWLANPYAPVEFDTLFTMSNLKAGVVTAVLSIAMAIGSKGVNNRDSASVLPAHVAPMADEDRVAAILAEADERVRVAESFGRPDQNQGPLDPRWGPVGGRHEPDGGMPG